MDNPDSGNDMNDTMELPDYTDEELAELSPAELIDVVIENEDRVPRNVIDECARRGDEMTNYLGMLHQHDFLWDLESGAGVWWLRLHAPMILGLIPSEQAGLLLVELMRRLSLEDEEQQDWLAGYWPALFKNKPDSVISSVRALSEDREVDWYIRSNAVEAVIDAGFRQDGAALARALAWLANLISDETCDWNFRLFAALTLLHYPRPEYRALLEDLADRQVGLGNVYDREDVQRAYAGESARQDIFTDPWQFYEPETIKERQIRWRKEAAEEARGLGRKDDDLKDFSAPYVPYILPETYVRPEPKVGRNDPCPCGSGKKYKKCCMAKE